MKTNKIIYWVSTGLIALNFLFAGFMYLSKNPELMGNFAKIGYPVFFVTMLGVAKLLGAVAIVNPWFPKLKEWAYAGFTFVLIGAIWTHVATQTPFIAALITLILLAVSYIFYNRLNSTAAKLK